MNTKFLADRAELHFNSYIPLYIMLAGIVVLVIGLLIFKKFDSNIKFVVPVMGGMALVIGAVFWLTRQNLVLIIDKKAQNIQIQEKTNEGTLTSTLPFDNFRALVVQRAVSTSRNNSSGTTSKSISFQIQLQRNDGAMIELATYHRFKNAYEFVQKLKTLVPYKVYIINTPIEEYQTYLKKFEQLEDTQLLDSYEPLLNFKFEQKPTAAQIQLPAMTSFAKQKNSQGTTYQWNNRKNIWTLLLVLIFIGGFIILIQMIEHRTFKLIANIFMGIVGLAAFYALLNSMFGSSSLRFDQQQLTYQNELFGMKTTNQSWDYSNIAGIMSKLNDSGDRSLNLSSKMGQDLLQRLAYDAPENLMSDLMGLVMNYKSYFMTIDMSGLLLSERLHLEQEISQKVATAHAQQ